jgi:phosphatidylglycerophosphatase A
MLEKINELALKVAMCGGLGRTIGGSIIASLFAIPVLLLGRIVWRFSFSWYMIGALIFFGVSIFIIQLSLRAISDQASSAIVLDKMLGMTIALAGISFSLRYWKILIVAFVLFHILNLLVRPLFVLNQTFAKIDSMQNVIGVVASDLFFGVTVNIIIRIAMLFLYR